MLHLYLDHPYYSNSIRFYESDVTFKVLIVEEDVLSYSRNRSIAMSYSNRFLIDEEIQNECLAVHHTSESAMDDWFDDEFSKFLKSQLIRMPQYELNSVFIHVIVAFQWNPSSSPPLYHVNQTFKYSLDMIPFCNIKITQLTSQRIECIQQEKYEQFNKQGGEVKVNAGNIVQVLESVGDDIEDFLEEMIFGWCFVPKKVISFNISLLSDEEESKMYPRNPSVGTDEDLSFGSDHLRNILPPITWKYENFKNKTRLAKNEQNYALSVCCRKTFIQDFAIVYEPISPFLALANLHGEIDLSPIDLDLSPELYNVYYF